MIKFIIYMKINKLSEINIDTTKNAPFRATTLKRGCGGKTPRSCDNHHFIDGKLPIGECATR